MIIFTKNECDYIKSFYFKEIKNEIDAKDPYDYGKGKITFSNAECKYILTKDKTLVDFLLEKLKDFGIISMHSVKIMRYKKGDYLEKHTDFSKYGSQVLYKAFFFQLSDKDDYVGGDLIVKGEIKSREQGAMCMINPMYEHEVTEIISGERFSMILFLFEENMNLKKEII